MVAVHAGERSPVLTRSRCPPRRLHMAACRSRRRCRRARRPTRTRCARSYEPARVDPPSPHARRCERARRRGRAPGRVSGRPAGGDERGAGARRSRADRLRAPASRAGRAAARLASCDAGGGDPPPHRSESRRDHGVVRQDNDEAVRAPVLAERTSQRVRQPGRLQHTGGLSRALNEQLAPGTEVFMADKMGTYGAGEIESMSWWMKPDIGRERRSGRFISNG